ncbi:hypothetical protein BRDID11004_59610 [Bradyrhizobium diazoefficiens]|uniref:Uncharacterized protein n=1 Tax=Bradyrhizobium diazoefficiens TaxID=1355477 RepID=A0A809ZRN8_9BRAD|nr:hypothetical protein [Bradyrhizobium diazoefficiens]BBZ93140.1 hypothetical protein F07S3_29730 [Bradyrhizobium diazoefficiens]BCA10891.1 hypothetical protein BDHF08_27380 [Bradyrhizobium diazoefficiens]BCE55226.1 hypothetical protein XF5B_27380 [Bradyrhizobium diazoefficiens]BCE63960.1 hypothetical protein XF6B_27590 [Bradyrhizobium diazoefficiens]
MTRLLRINRPDCEKAFAFDMGVCGDPDCGLHLIPSRKDGTPICEMVIGRDQLRDMLAIIHDKGLDLP